MYWREVFCLKNIFFLLLTAYLFESFIDSTLRVDYPRLTKLYDDFLDRLDVVVSQLPSIKRNRTIRNCDPKREKCEYRPSDLNFDTVAAVLTVLAYGYGLAFVFLVLEVVMKFVHQRFWMVGAAIYLIGVGIRNAGWIVARRLRDKVHVA